MDIQRQSLGYLRRTIQSKFRGHPGRLAGVSVRTTTVFPRAGVDLCLWLRVLLGYWFQNFVVSPGISWAQEMRRTRLDVDYAK
jgi:hypothetical protein